MLTIDEILAKAELITLETQIDSITPARVGELFSSLAEQLQLGVGSGATIGASKLSELSDVMLLNAKDNDILQKIGTKWTNSTFNLTAINQLLSWFKLDANGNIYTDLNFYSKGGLACYGAGPDGGSGTGYDRLDAWSAYTAEKSGWVLSAFLGNNLNARVSALEAGGTGSGSDVAWGTPAGGHVSLTVDSVMNILALATHEHTISQITDFPTSMSASDVYAWAKAASKPTYAWNEINNKPDVFTPDTHDHYVADILNFPTSLPASDVYAWAKAASKPTYNFSEIGSKPTTLSGYGISDAAGLASLNNHIADAVKHITSTERNSWNATSVNSHLHNNKTSLDAINQFLSTTSSPTFADLSINGISASDKSVKNFINKFNSMFDFDAQGFIYAKTDFYSVGGVSSYGLGTPSEPILNSNLNANGKNIYNATFISGYRMQASDAYIGIDNDYIGLFEDINGNVIAAYYDHNQTYIFAGGAATVDAENKMVCNGGFKFGNYTFKQDGSGRLGIYYNTTEVACFNTDGTYVNL